MTEPLSDRLLDALGDPVAREAIRLLLDRDLTQSELIEELEVAQATVSRVVKVLRAVGLVEPVGGGRGPRLAPTARDAAIGVLLAADRLAETILELEAHAQRDRSKATRRSAVRPAQKPRDASAEHQNGA